MSDIRVVGTSTATSRVGEGVWRDVAGTRDGAIYVADEGLKLSLAGELYVANGGTASSPITFAGAFDADGPDMVIDVPDGTTIQILNVHVQYEAVGTTLLLETFCSVSNTLGAVSAGTAVTPRNVRTDHSTGSGCTVNAAVDAAGCTAQTGRIYEFGRGGFELAEAMAATEDWQERTWKWSAKQEGWYPTIVGDGSLFVHAASQAGTGFITVVYAEYATTDIL